MTSKRLTLRSLRARLALLWLSVAAACAVAAYLMLEMFQISVSAQIDRAGAILSRSCTDIAERYHFYSAGWRGTQDLQNDTLKRDLQAVVNLALSDQPGVEGGIWQSEAGRRWPTLSQPMRAAAQRPTFQPRNTNASNPSIGMRRASACQGKRSSRDVHRRSFFAAVRCLDRSAASPPGP